MRMAHSCLLIMIVYLKVWITILIERIKLNHRDLLKAQLSLCRVLLSSGGMVTNKKWKPFISVRALHSLLLNSVIFITPVSILVSDTPQVLSSVEREAYMTW